MKNELMTERDAQSIYDNIVSPYYEAISEEKLSQKSKDTVLQIYKSLANPDISDIFQEIYNHNYNVACDGLMAEIDVNPDFQYLKHLRDFGNRRKFDEEIARTAQVITDSIDIYDMYYYVLDIIIDGKNSMQMFSEYDVMVESFPSIEEKYGKGNVCIACDCQNTLLRAFFKEMLDDFGEYIDEKYLDKLKPKIFGQNLVQNVRMLT